MSENVVMLSALVLDEEPRCVYVTLAEPSEQYSGISPLSVVRELSFYNTPYVIFNVAEEFVESDTMKNITGLFRDTGYRVEFDFWGA